MKYCRGRKLQNDAAVFKEQQEQTTVDKHESKWFVDLQGNT
jgi:hypothetical protein